MKFFRIRNQIFCPRLEYFLNNSYLHGVRYLGQRCGILGKLFWAAVLIVSLYGMLEIFLLTYQYFTTDVISIGIDTAYLNWNNTFPAISICLSKGRNSSVLGNALRKYFEENGLQLPKRFVQYSRRIHSYLFTNPNKVTEINQDCILLNSTCGVNIEILQNQFFAKSCQEFMINLKFAGRSYNCEDIFKLHKTEMGHCFMANSIIFYEYDFSMLPLKFSRGEYNRILEFQYKELEIASYDLYIHSPEELPNFNLVSRPLPKPTGTLVKLYYSLVEMINMDGVRDLPIKSRACRFPDERLDNSAYHYSFSTCLSDIRIRLELEACNCTLFTSPEKCKVITRGWFDKSMKNQRDTILVPGAGFHKSEFFYGQVNTVDQFYSPRFDKSRYCDIYGYNCLYLADINEETKELHYKKETSCPQSCNEMELNFIGQSNVEVMYLKENYLGEINIEILNLPSVRYQRDVAKTRLDLVVSIGGVAGLFFGASLLSMVEFVYIWFFRKIEKTSQ